MTNTPALSTTSADEPRIRLDLSIAHAQSLAELIDLATRMHLGQFTEIAGLARMHKILARSDLQGGNGQPIDIIQSEQLEEVLRSAEHIMGHIPGRSNFSIGSPGVSPECKRGYETLKVLQKALHEHLTPNTKHTVNGDGLLVRYDQGPAPVATIKSDVPGS